MSVTKLASRGVYHAMGKATEQLHQENFPHALMEVFRRAITYDYSMILIYPIDSIPQRIYEDNISELTEKKGRMRYYVDGMYLLDPLYQLILQQPDPGFYSLREIAPDNFYRSEFFKHHFAYTHLKDDNFYLLPLEGVGTMVITIGSARRFNRAELERFHTLEPWVLSMMKCHWSIPSTQKLSSEHISLHQELTASLQNFGRSRLTDRECDIAQMILRGHSSKSAALKLNISHETVKTHRRHIYQKLDLRSQSELFSLFLNAVTTQGGAFPYADPLEAYLAQLKCR